MKKRILIIDDHVLVVDILYPILTEAWGYDVHRAKDLESALQLLSVERSFDLILLDFQLPDVDGLNGLQAMISADKGPVALFSGVVGRATVKSAIELGARGWIPKTLTMNLFRGAIDLVMLGEVFLPSSFWSGPAKEPNGAHNLKERELRVLELLCLGLPNKAISEKLEIDLTLVKLDVKSICTKLGVANRTQAGIVARKRGLA